MPNSEFIQELPEGKLTVEEVDKLLDALFEYEMRHSHKLHEKYESARDKLGAALGHKTGEWSPDDN